MKNFLNKIIADWKDFNWKNEQEEPVIASNYFSAYKGKFVLRTNRLRSGSVGLLFITRKGSSSKIKELIRHEYGHTEQLRQLGFLRYLLFIGIPSWKQWNKEIPYYERPWEITADLFGGVTTRKHKEQDMQKGLAYLESSKKRKMFLGL